MLARFKYVLAGALLAAATVSIPHDSQAASLVEFVLPYPGDGSGAVFGTYDDAQGQPRDAILLDGIPIAFKYDEVWSYSTKVLSALQSAATPDFLPEPQFGNYNPSAGTGTLDLVLYVNSAGTDNQNIGPAGDLDFPDPSQSPTGGGPNSTMDKVWPEQGSTTVGQLLDYLHAFDPNNNIPVFTLDLNQTGSGPEVFITAEFYLCTDAACSNKVESWSLDTIANDAFDPLATALAFGGICFGVEADCGQNTTYLGPTISGNTYSVNHNQGSGAFDFAAFTPTMILSNYDPNLFFGTRFVLSGLNDGGETISLAGRFAAPPDQQDVPEPATLALMGAGLMALAALRRRIAT